MEEKKNDLCLYYNFISGDIYYVMQDEVKNLDKYQLPLLKKPSTSCHKCYGRGYVGKDIKKNIYMPCKCMQKCFDFSKIKKDYIDTEKVSLQKQ